MLSGIEYQTFNLLFKSLKTPKGKFKQSKKMGEQKVREMTTKMYTTMNFIFLFPKLYKKLNYDENKYSSAYEDIKVSTAKEIIKNEDSRMYFPKDFNKFIESFLKTCQSFKFSYEDMILNNKSFSKTKFSCNSLNSHNSDLE